MLLEEIGGETAVKAVASLLGDQNKEMKRLAIATLTNIGHPSAKPLLEAAAKNDKTVKNEALAALKYLKDNTR